MFGAIGRFFARIFGRQPAQPPPPPDPNLMGMPGVRPPMMSIPNAPVTLMNRIDRLGEEEREMLRTAEEALRRGYPDQARIAYWKAVRFYLSGERPLKAIAVLSSILRIAPNDVEAWITRAQANVALDRRRDAALSFFEAANVFESMGDGAHALEMLEQCLDLDPELDGLQLRYKRLGGTRDVWTGRPAAPKFGDNVVGGISAPRSQSQMHQPAQQQGLHATPRASGAMFQGVMPTPRGGSAMGQGLPAATPRAGSAMSSASVPNHLAAQQSMQSAPAVPLPSSSPAQLRQSSAMSAAKLPGARAPSVHDEMMEALAPAVPVVPGTPATGHPGTYDIGGPIDLDLDNQPEPPPRKPTAVPQKSRSTANALAQSVGTAPADPVHSTDVEPARDPNLVSHEIEIPEPPKRVTRPTVRFNIPSAATAYEPGPPAAMLGSEHDPEPEAMTVLGLEAVHAPEHDTSDDQPIVSGDTDAPTAAYDARELDALIAETKRKAKG